MTTAKDMARIALAEAAEFETCDPERSINALRAAVSALDLLRCHHLAPSDGDRKALAIAISKFRHNSEIAWDEDLMLADAILAAGFRRQSPSAPSDDEREAITAAVDEVLNPFGRATREQERLVTDSAMKWAESRQSPAPSEMTPEALAEAVERAAEQMHMRSSGFAGRKSWENTTDRIRTAWRHAARDVLDAAFPDHRYPYVAHGEDSVVRTPSVICRECAETKHGACDGMAMVERGDDVERVSCICADHGHGVFPVVAHPGDIRTGQRDVDTPAWREDR